MSNTTKVKPDPETPADFSAIIDDLAALRRDFAALVSEMKSSTAKGASEAAETTLGQLGERASDLYESAVAQGERTAKALGREVEERPVTSLLIAFGIGFIVSRLLSR